MDFSLLTYGNATNGQTEEYVQEADIKHHIHYAMEVSGKTWKCDSLTLLHFSHSQSQQKSERMHRNLEFLRRKNGEMESE